MRVGVGFGVCASHLSLALWPSHSILTHLGGPNRLPTTDWPFLGLDVPKHDSKGIFTPPPPSDPPFEVVSTLATAPTQADNFISGRDDGPGGGGCKGLETKNWPYLGLDNPNHDAEGTLPPHFEWFPTLNLFCIVLDKWYPDRLEGLVMCDMTS